MELDFLGKFPLPRVEFIKMKNEPNIEQIVQPHSTAHLTIAKLMENLKFSQMTFPIFPHFANDRQSARSLRNLESSSNPDPIQKHSESFFLATYFWIIFCSGVRGLSQELLIKRIRTKTNTQKYKVFWFFFHDSLILFHQFRLTDTCSNPFIICSWFISSSAPKIRKYF